MRAPFPTRSATVPVARRWATPARIAYHCPARIARHCYGPGFRSGSLDYDGIFLVAFLLLRASLSRLRTDVEGERAAMLCAAILSSVSHSPFSASFSPRHRLSSWSSILASSCTVVSHGGCIVSTTVRIVICTWQKENPAIECEDGFKLNTCLPGRRSNSFGRYRSHVLLRVNRGFQAGRELRARSVPTPPRARP